MQKEEEEGLLKISNLNYKIENRAILDNINCVFPFGSLCCIIGKNGSGKTTLLKAIAKLIKTEGDIFFNDKNLEELKLKERAKTIAYLPQNREMPALTVRLMVEHGRFPYLGFSKVLTEKDKEIVNSAIEKANIQQFVSRRLTELSGGELQKVYIATTVAQEAKVFLFDEPTTHLDLESQQDILNLISSLKNRDSLVIVVLHDLLQAFTYFDQIYLMDKGKLVDYGTPEQLIKNGYVKNVFNYDISRDLSRKSLYEYKLIKI